MYFDVKDSERNIFITENVFQQTIFHEKRELELVVSLYPAAEKHLTQNSHTGPRQGGGNRTCAGEDSGPKRAHAGQEELYRSGMNLDFLTPYVANAETTV
jgi:hypothetical protein